MGVLVDTPSPFLMASQMMRWRAWASCFFWGSVILGFGHLCGSQVHPRGLGSCRPEA